MIDPRSAHLISSPQGVMEQTSRKRRRVETENYTSSQTEKNTESHLKSSPYNRRILHPISARPHTDNPELFYSPNDSNTSGNGIGWPTKRRRHHSDRSPPAASPPGTDSSKPSFETSQTLSSLLLRPCHICHRRPTTRAVLDAYADCELCNQRTCYVCLRQCGNITCGLLPEESQDILVLQKLYGDRIPLRAKLRPRRVCSSCALEGIDPDGEEVIRCVECFDEGKRLGNEPQLSNVSWLTDPDQP